MYRIIVRPSCVRYLIYLQIMLIHVCVIVILSPSPSIGHSQIAAKPTVTLSPDDKALLNDINLPPSRATYLANLIMERHRYSNENKELAKDIKVLDDDNKKWQTKYYNAQCLLPHVDFECAMRSIKILLANFYNKHIKAVYINETYSCPDIMDEHTKSIINLYDGRPDSVPGKDWKKMTAYDRNSTYRWNEYITCDWQSGNTPFTFDSRVVKKLQQALKSFYEKTHENIKIEREYKDLNTFKLRFASVITRCHRLACRFHHNFDHPIMEQISVKREPNGNRLNLIDALLNVVPNWYFDDEHIQLLNIVQETMELPDRYYNAANFTNKLNKDVVLPGKPNCGQITVEPGFYEKIYSLAPTD